MIAPTLAIALSVAGNAASVFRKFVPIALTAFALEHSNGLAAA
jgi:hypothetical protein